MLTTQLQPRVVSRQCSSLLIYLSVCPLPPLDSIHLYLESSTLSSPPAVLVVKPQPVSLFGVHLTCLQYSPPTDCSSPSRSLLPWLPTCLHFALTLIRQYHRLERLPCSFLVSSATWPVADSLPASSTSACFTIIFRGSAPVGCFLFSSEAQPLLAASSF